jgi:hypothetical protein
VLKYCLYIRKKIRIEELNGLDHETRLKYFDKIGWSYVHIRALRCFSDFEDGKVQNPKRLAAPCFLLVHELKSCFLLFHGISKLHWKEKFMKTLPRCVTKNDSN